MAEMTKTEFAHQVTLALIHSIKDWAPAGIDVEDLTRIVNADKEPETIDEAVRMSQDFLALMLAEQTDKIVELTY